MKILILRFSSMGDIVLTTPVIRCLKQQIPNLKLHYATKEPYFKVLQHNPYLDVIHLLKPKETPSLIESLKKEKFDLIIDLHNNLRTFRIKKSLGIKSIAFNKINLKKWLAVRLKNKSLLPQTHVVERYLETIKPLGITNDGLGLDFFEGETSLSENLLKVLKQSFIVYGIGGQHSTKRLPVIKMKEFFKNLTIPLVLLGGKEDFETGEALKNLLPNKEIWNICGSLDILQSALLIKHCTSVVSHDTAVMHIGAAYQKPIYSIWGNTIPEFGMTPYFGRNSNAENLSMLFEVKELSCRPCSKIGFEKCPKGHFDCMNKQDFSDVRF